jgi:flagellar basal-body rod modification protein FlgD
MLAAPIDQKVTDPSLATDASAAALGRQDFLKMLIAQLENQDPLNPQESTEFTAQLAQFSSLEQQIAMRDSLGSINDAMKRADSVTAIGMIGQEVLAESEQFELGESGVAPLLFELDSATTDTVIAIRDASGSEIARIDLGALPAGLNQYDWNGSTGPNTPPAEAGTYSLSVEATARNERDQPIPVEATSLISGRVEGADVTGHAPMLLLGNLILPLSEVREVYEPLAASPIP